MLKSVVVSKLFGYYDYNIDLSVSESDKIRFITAPNGYGKTTILRLINGLFGHRLDEFFLVPFASVEFIVDDAVFCARQNSLPSEQTDQDADDERIVTFEFGSVAGTHDSILLRLVDLKNPTPEIEHVLNQIDLFFSSETCRYIDDKRLLHEGTDSSELLRLADLLKELQLHTSGSITKQLSALKRIVDRCDFANKTFELSPRFGFRFVAKDENQTKLTMSDLSSGEQHILLLTLYMLFDAPEKAIVLIDEPEMSLHLSWQGDYLKNLREIVNLRNIQCVVATHSPFIFASEYDISVDLYELTH